MDARGLPGCFVVTTEFESAVDAQSKTLGFQPAIVWLEHPIQNRTDDELESLARDAMDDILSAIHQTG